MASFEAPVPTLRCGTDVFGANIHNIGAVPFPVSHIARGRSRSMNWRQRNVHCQFRENGPRSRSYGPLRCFRKLPCNLLVSSPLANVTEELPAEGDNGAIPEGEEESIDVCATRFVSDIFDCAVDDISDGAVFDVHFFECSKEEDTQTDNSTDIDSQVDEYEEVQMSDDEMEEDFAIQSLLLVKGAMLPMSEQTENKKPFSIELGSKSLDQESFQNVSVPTEEEKEHEEPSSAEEEGQELVYEPFQVQDWVLDYACGLLDDYFSDVVVTNKGTEGVSDESRALGEEIDSFAIVAHSEDQVTECASTFLATLREPAETVLQEEAFLEKVESTPIVIPVSDNSSSTLSPFVEPTSTNKDTQERTTFSEVCGSAPFSSSVAEAASPEKAFGIEAKSEPATKVALEIPPRTSPRPASSMHSTRSKRRIIGGVVRTPVALEKPTEAPLSATAVPCVSQRVPPFTSQAAFSSSLPRDYDGLGHVNVLDQASIRKKRSTPSQPSSSMQVIPANSKMPSAMSLDLGDDVPTKPCTRFGTGRGPVSPPPPRPSGPPPDMTRSASLGALRMNTAMQGNGRLPALQAPKVMKPPVFLPALPGTKISSIQSSAGSAAWSVHRAKKDARQDKQFRGFDVPLHGDGIMTTF